MISKLKSKACIFATIFLLTGCLFSSESESEDSTVDNGNDNGSKTITTLYEDVEVTVLNSTTSSPIPDAKVAIKTKSGYFSAHNKTKTGYTDASGKVMADNLAYLNTSGGSADITITVTVSAPSFKEVTTSKTNLIGGTTSFTISLTPQ